MLVMVVMKLPVDVSARSLHLYMYLITFYCVTSWCLIAKADVNLNLFNLCDIAKKKPNEIWTFRLENKFN